MTNSTSSLRNFLLLLLSIVFIYTASAQKIIELHPILGDTIDQIEKETYLLFPAIEDSLFDYGYIMTDSIDYFLHFHSSTGINSSTIDSDQITEGYMMVEKLSTYFGHKTNLDSVYRQESILLIEENENSKKVTTISVGPEMQKKIARDARNMQTRRNRADQQGLMGRDRERHMNNSGAMSITILDNTK